MKMHDFLTEISNWGCSEDGGSWACLFVAPKRKTSVETIGFRFIVCVCNVGFAIYAVTRKLIVCLDRKE